MMIHEKPTIYKPGAYKSPGIYNGAGGIYKGCGVYNDGVGGNVPGVEIGGRVYQTVIMPDGKEWIVENLDYKFNVNGSQIPIGQGDNPSTPSAWYYNNNEINYGLDGTYKCGLLYNWYAAVYLDNNSNDLLPSGWRVPSRSDLNDLASAVGFYGGDKAKAIDGSVTSGFPSGWNGTNEYGFFVLPSGYREWGSFSQFGTRFDMWSITSLNSSYGTSLYTDQSNTFTTQDYVHYKHAGLAIRLCKDAS